MNDLTDMHCHLLFATNAQHIASYLANSGIACFTNTVIPSEWERCNREFGDYPTITIGYGWHPWWIQADSSVRELRDYLDAFQPKALGEIGLDFSTRHATTRQQQFAIFEEFAQWAAIKQDCLLSIHAVHAAGEALEILNRAGAFKTCHCIFHWFSGSANELQAALKYGCYFSVNTRMIASKKGREYVRQIPTDRLLLESDLPSQPGTPLQADDLVDNLRQTAQAINEIKGANCSVVMNETARLLLHDAYD